MSTLFGLSIAGVLVGIALVVSAFRETPSVAPGTFSPHVPLPHDWRQRLLQGMGAGLLLGVITRWPVGVIAGATIGWFAKDFVGGKAARELEIARTEAIASWTEMLRDTISSAHGIEEAISATSAVAPAPIRREVIGLATALEREPIDIALTRFADDLAHAIGDLVVAALRLAATGSTRDLAELLGTLAVTARDECGMRLRVEAARARIHTAVRVITGCTLLTALGLIVFNRKYLAVYDDATGQGVLVLIAVMWGASLVWLSRMSRIAAPERFLVSAGGSR